MNLINLLFTYEGRINRAKWWLAMLVYMILLLILVALWFIPVLGMIAGVIGWIAAVVSGVMVGIKRLHDRDKSGWWMLLFYGVPFLCGMAQQTVQQDSAPDVLLTLVNLVILGWMTVELGCLRGTIGPNRYGPDPLAPKPAA